MPDTQGRTRSHTPDEEQLEGAEPEEPEPPAAEGAEAGTKWRLSRSRKGGRASALTVRTPEYEAVLPRGAVYKASDTVEGGADLDASPPLVHTSIVRAHPHDFAPVEAKKSKPSGAKPSGAKPSGAKPSGAKPSRSKRKKS